jgi:hypothetical protein
VDQEPLVREWIDAAKKFLDELEKLQPVRAAFWLKEDEDTRWYLYVATDKLRNGSVAADYEEVSKASDAVDDPNFDSTRVKLIGLKDPLARAALEMYRRYPTRIPIFRWGEPFGKTYVEGLYLYPLPVAALSQ